jgi:hypothetical protein
LRKIAAKVNRPPGGIPALNIFSFLLYNCAGAHAAGIRCQGRQEPSGDDAQGERLDG